MKTCPYCQHENPMDARFCAHCGQLLASSEENIGAKTESVLPEETEENVLTVISTSAPTQYDRTSIPDPEIGLQAHIVAEPTLQNTPSSEEEKERNIDFTPPLLPMGGQAAPTPAPMVQGTPQLSTVPTVQGTPQLSTVPTVQGTPQTPPSSTESTTSENGTRLSRISRSTRATRHLVKGAGAKVGIAVIISAIVVVSAIRVLPHSFAGSQAQTKSSSYATKGSHVLKTEPVPPTQTSCPTTGNARAAVTAPLVLGKDDALIYIDDSTIQPGSYHGAGILKRYNITSGQSIELAHFNNEVIANARLSADGQWVLFETTQSTDIATGPPPPPVATKLYMVRVDGQGLQTLYCSSGRYIQDVIDNKSITWSPDSRYIAFSEVDNQGNEHITVLNTVTGTLQKEIPTKQKQGLVGTYEPLPWLDNTHLYITRFSPVSVQYFTRGIYMLDISAGANQQSGNLKTIVSLQEFANESWDFAVSPDRKLLYLSQTPIMDVSTGLPLSSKSSITVRSVSGGTPTQIYSSTTKIISDVQIIDALTLRFYMRSLSLNTDKQAGYWTVKMNGTHLTRLNYVPLTEPEFGSNIFSPDNKFIAFIATTSQPDTSYTTTLHIKIVPTSGGQTIAVADSNQPLLDNSTGDLRLAGWTTI